MKNHFISPIASLSAIKKASLLSVTSPIIQYNQCELHNQRAKELYCMTRNECVCVDCIGVSHINHPVKSVINRRYQEGWKKEMEEISNDIINNDLKEVNIQSEKLSKEIDQVNEEIKSLEDTLKNLIEKKGRMMADLNRMKLKRRSIKRLLFYYSFFNHFLPSLSLPSSFSIIIIII